MDTVVTVVPISELEEMLDEEVVCETLHGTWLECPECRPVEKCIQPATHITASSCCGIRRLKCRYCVAHYGRWRCHACGSSCRLIGVVPV